MADGRLTISAGRQRRRRPWQMHYSSSCRRFEGGAHPGLNYLRRSNRSWFQVEEGALDSLQRSSGSTTGQARAVYRALMGRILPVQVRITVVLTVYLHLE